MKSSFDIFIIGGGINGAGIARDASGRGLKVGLSDMGNVGQATSSWSSKLIHGGLRYLENYEFKLVHESLKERSIINNIASSITSPIPFIIPHSKELRPSWLIRIGLIIYDNLGGKTSIPKSSKIKIKDECSKILKDKYINGFKYYDLQVDDQQLVKLNIKDAIKNGAKIYEKNKVINAQREDKYWNIKLKDNKEIKTKVLINAAGPWVNEVMHKILNINTSQHLRLVKGSHIITKKLYEQKIAFTLQNIDKRIIFIIPYNNNTLIGTTEVEVKSPYNPEIDKDEINYLIKSVNRYLNKEISKEDIKSSYSGIRPLIENIHKKNSNISRDYAFEINKDNNLAPVINIYGGKLTTYRKLSSQIVSNLKVFFPNISHEWTHDKKLF